MEMKKGGKPSRPAIMHGWPATTSPPNHSSTLDRPQVRDLAAHLNHMTD